MEIQSVTLPSGHRLRRLPRRATLPRRTRAFFEQFEDRVLYYDCFRAQDGTLGLIGPNPANLLGALERARFIAMPQGITLEARHYTGDASRVPTLYTRLSGAPDECTHLEIRIEDLSLSVAIGADVSGLLAGRRVMTTMNRDNNLEWVEDWCRWHSVMHGIDAVVLFDNASRSYDAGALRAAALRGLQGGAAAPEAIVVHWPFRFGPFDPGVIFRPYWALMSQQAAMLLALRRFAPMAEVLLNCDIDELVGGEDLGDALKAAPEGHVALRGHWIVPEDDREAAGPLAHLAHGFTHRNPLKSVCSGKWALRPVAPRFQDPGIVLKTHRIPGLDARAAPTRPFYHFRAINTGWKERWRSQSRPPRSLLKWHEPLARDREIFMQRWSARRFGPDASEG